MIGRFFGLDAFRVRAATYAGRRGAIRRCFVLTVVDAVSGEESRVTTVAGPRTFSSLAAAREAQAALRAGEEITVLGPVVGNTDEVQVSS